MYLLEKHNIVIIFLTHHFLHVLGAQKNGLIEMVHFSNHNIGFG